MNKAIVPAISLSALGFLSQLSLANSISGSELDSWSKPRTSIQILSPTLAEYATIQKNRGLKKSSVGDDNELIPVMNQYNTLYYSKFQIGSNGQSFTAVQDTGSSNIWVPDLSCQSEACDGKDKFDNSSSSTFYTHGEKLSIQYGSGNMTGIVGYDSVLLGSLTVHDQGFGLAGDLSTDFLNTPFDGIFGLAYKSLAEDKIVPWLDNTVNQGDLSSAVFSFYLSSTPGDGNSRLILGEPDTNYYSGDIEWVSLVDVNSKLPTDLYYNIAFQSIAVNNQRLNLSCYELEMGCKTIVDSGTSFIIGPKDDIDLILQQIDIQPDCSNIDQQPQIEIRIGDIGYTLPPELYIVKMPDEAGNLKCTPAFAPSNSPLWILGDAFMRGFYTVFDKGGSRVGFAELASHLSVKSNGDSDSLRVLPRQRR